MQFLSAKVVDTVLEDNCNLYIFKLEVHIQRPNLPLQRNASTTHPPTTVEGMPNAITNGNACFSKIIYKLPKTFSAPSLMIFQGVSICNYLSLTYATPLLVMLNEWRCILFSALGPNICFLQQPLVKHLITKVSGVVVL